MSAARIFAVRVNLDDFGAALLRWRSDADRSAWLSGFQLGCHGNATAPSDPPAMIAGNAFGLETHAEAVGYQARQAEFGRKSADARRASRGSAVPEGASNDPAKVARTTHRGSSEPRPEPAPNPSTIHNPLSNIEQPAAAAARSANAHAGELQDTPQPPPPPPSGNLADLRAMHPAFLPLGADDMDRAKRMLSLYGFDICNKRLSRLTAEAAKRHPGKRRVLVGEWADDLAENVELAVEDYAAAGLPAPPGTPTQDELNRKDS